MTRVTIEDADYARWLAEIQERDRQPDAFSRAFSFWGAGAAVFFLVVFGVPIVLVIVVAIVHLVR